MKIHYPTELPIVSKRDDIIQAIGANQVVVVTGDTGSGKSTQLPKMCLEAGRGDGRLIGCTQPRRIAAVTLAQRVAEELGPGFRGRVGYKIRFRDRTTRATRIKFMTDGILLAETQSDRLFRAYDTIIVDEAHERSLNIDFLLGILRRNLHKRPDLKVIITSATIDPEKFSEAFDGAPIVEVSGRTYPVAVWYRPPAENEAGADAEITHVDRAIRAVRELKRCGERGDILIFMPTESDIRETVSRLEKSDPSGKTLVLPLFGRLAGTDQRRVFQRSGREKIVVATNVAETSITIAGIKYVIDPGLARISRYNARSRTQGLPIAAISRASADQRKGRCGRVMAGICIRLYDEDDYLARAPFTPPEIQRSNLAEVILRMLSLRLGDVSKFPFLDPPSPAAVKDGFAVLRELGAVNNKRRLTRTGEIMARFPLDPRLSRILLAAKKENAVAEMVVLCAALSIQNPKERPLEQEQEADRAHAPYRDRRSDFVSLLKIWTAYQDRRKTAKSRNQMRRFCRDSFLSFRRLQQWQDIHDEIMDILKELGGFKPNRQPASYEALHRCIAAGYLSNIAMKKDKNQFIGSKGRQLMIFPGSGLFNKAGNWVVASELVQTSRLFARTVANIEPEWLEALAQHVCKYTYLEPHWEKRAGRVLAWEQVTLYGLRIVDRRKIDYARIKPAEAKEIFIRSALIQGELSVDYPFLEHNRQLLEQIERMENKMRRRELLVDEEAIYDFYDRKLPQLSDIRTLNKWIKEQRGDDCLRMSEADLLRADPDRERLQQFPDYLEVAGARLPVRYHFNPAETDDGMTVTVPLHLLPRLEPEPFEWLVPGLLGEKLTMLLKGLPKSVRRGLVPIPHTVEQIRAELSFGRGDLHQQLTDSVRRLTGVLVAMEQWKRIQAEDGWPAHLLPRFEVVEEDGAVIGAGRDLAGLQAGTVKVREDQLWNQARSRYERTGLTSWDFGDLPFEILLGKDAYGVERMAYLGITAEQDQAAVRLFHDGKEAMQATRDGLLVLYQRVFSAQIKAHAKDWRFPTDLADALFFLGDRKKAERALYLYLFRQLFELQEPLQPDQARFRAKAEELRGGLGLKARELLREVIEVVRERRETRQAFDLFKQRSKGNPGAVAYLGELEKDLNQLAPHDFLTRCRRAWIVQLPRYLRALQIRAERAYVAPEKDRQKAQELRVHLDRLQQAEAVTATVEPRDEAAEQFLDEFRFMVEEFKISLFAPEIKTRWKISGKRLNEKWRKWQARYGNGSG